VIARNNAHEADIRGRRNTDGSSASAIENRQRPRGRRISDPIARITRIWWGEIAPIRPADEVHGVPRGRLARSRCY